MATFIAEVTAGRQTLAQVDVWVERWHNGEEGKELTLRESLGLTEAQYAAWMCDPATLAAVVVDEIAR